MEDLMRVALAALAIGFGWYKLLEIGEASSTRVNGWSDPSRSSC